MNYILFDDPVFRNQLKPLTFTRPIASLRVGVLTIVEKWQKYLQAAPSFLSENYLNKKFPTQYEDLNVYINASYLPNLPFLEAIKNLKEGQVLTNNDRVLAICAKKKLAFDQIESFGQTIVYSGEVSCLLTLPDLFLRNASEISNDFALLTANKKTAAIKDPFTAVYNSENIFIEEGVSIKASILNAENGPIYIGKNAIIQEGSLLIGPVAVGEGSMVAFGAKIRPNTTIGPSCRVGGEVGNSIFYGFSNKAHDGFLGNSYIGEWCNLGANTNNSNLKNDYKSVKLFNYHTGALADTHELFVGTFMADYAKAGISTMFNTGTVVGVCANVFGAGFQEKHIPSFSWGGKAEGVSSYRFDKALEVINATMNRRNTQLSAQDLEILTYIAANPN
jgi:UDP-N-acetylglucosamine diphosphorylase / glucose-1-phosphate thymidylyltransferase / UDP-N-acetylgalactosamine diphosphorylase / glucosamine-1-phosphate N-acetyltransferase / galactosamine-1-phosphate N-acetyltransferase